MVVNALWNRTRKARLSASSETNKRRGVTKGQVLRCERPCIELRKIMYRGTVRQVTHDDRACIETRNMPFRKTSGRKGRSDSAKTALWLHGSRKITTQVSNQKTRQARLRFHSPQSTPLGFTPNRSLDRNRWVVRILRILFNSCQRFFRHLASICVST